MPRGHLGGGILNGLRGEAWVRTKKDEVRLQVGWGEQEAPGHPHFPPLPHQSPALQG